ncbi:MAG: HEAT repeat domain-containing protein [bacterium]|nr:HEAT repeat domain-containing protein [bacterium]
MKRMIRSGLALAAGTLTLLPFTTGHGGTYRGPGDTVPPGAGGGGGGGGGPSSPGPGSPGTPGPVGPATPGPGSPGTPGSGPGGFGGPSTGAASGSTDLNVWDFWWEFNKAPYLSLKSKVHGGAPLTGSEDYFLGFGEHDQAKDSLRPSEAQVRTEVVPALLRALEREQSKDILTGALIALAKIGDVAGESGESELTKAITRFLRHSDTDVAETAAVALGILADERSVPMLLELLEDGPKARKLLGKTEVPVRMRAFAGYGLGLVGHRSGDNELRQDIARRLMAILDTPSFSRRDIKVAAMTALGLTPVDGAGELTLEAQIDFLRDYLDPAEQRANKTTREWFVRAHAPTALARLFEGTGPELDERRELVVGELRAIIGPHSKSRNELQMSCVLALGQLVTAAGTKWETEARAELMRNVKQGDQQSRRFALIALAQAAGTPGSGEDGLAGTHEARQLLLKHMGGGKTQIKPWAALAVGVLGRQLLDENAPIEPGAAYALRSAATENIRPSEAGAYLVALGIRRDTEAREIALEKLDYFQGSDNARGYAAVALGLMEDRSSIEAIQRVIVNSKYKPELLKQAAIGLGLLGDKSAVPGLIEMLGQANVLSTQAGLATALGAIGDARSIDPLIEMLGNQGITETARSFAAVALGIVCDKEDLPWNAKIAVGINYRANTETLTGQGNGILDIL